MRKPSPESPIGNGKPHRWRRYPKYKPSGVEWLGEVPEEWSVQRVKSLEKNATYVVQTGPFGAQLHSSDYLDDGVPLILIRNVNNLRIDDSEIPKISKEDAIRLSLYQLEIGDIVFSRVGSIGRIALCTEREKGWLISGQMLRLRIKNQKLDKKFSIYVFSSTEVERYIDLQSIGSTRESINTEILSNIPLQLPPLPEQTTIAAFLDRETARIDALIAKKERQIELLQEKRAAFISHAVTKGLDPSVKMKDSRVEWIGDVPEGWEVIPLKYGWNVTDCKHITAEYVDDGIPIVSTTEVKPGRLSLINTRKTIEADYLNSIDGRCPKRGDIIYSRNASLGSAAYVDTDEKFCMGQDVCLIASDSNNGLFLTYQLNCPIILNQIESQMIGSTIKRINVEQIKNLTVIKPPVQEQKKISLYLDIAINELDSLANTIENSITLLNEYRSALISSAVTGKIDVRQEVMV
jgi:restriction endonuclease S subunit